MDGDGVFDVWALGFVVGAWVADWERCASWGVDCWGWVWVFFEEEVSEEDEDD